MVTYAVFFFAALLSARDKIAAAVSSEFSANVIRALYWVFPKTAELGRATVSLVSGGMHGVGPAAPMAVYGSTALFGIVSLGLAAWRFSRKDF
jgi:hypothetical protein